MKRILLLRHGKSDWNASFSSDHGRTLAPRGERAARQVGQFLRAANHVPDRIVSSSAVRARRTVEIASEAGAWNCPIEVTDRLYGTSVEGALREIRSQEDSKELLLLVGHEPVWSDLTSALTGGSRVRVVTGCLVCMGFETEKWRGIDLGLGILQWVLPPKLLEFSKD